VEVVAIEKNKVSAIFLEFVVINFLRSTPMLLKTATNRAPSKPHTIPMKMAAIASVNGE
jgi:hypothetical protein